MFLDQGLCCSADVTIMEIIQNTFWKRTIWLKVCEGQEEG